MLCSGTDRGVSAKTIVASGKLLDYDDEFGSSMQNHYAVEQLNRMLPEDIRVFSCGLLSYLFFRYTSEQVVSSPSQYAHANVLLLPSCRLSPPYSSGCISIRVGSVCRRLLVPRSTELLSWDSLDEELLGVCAVCFSPRIHCSHRNKNLHQFYYRTMFCLSFSSTLDKRSLPRPSPSTTSSFSTSSSQETAFFTTKSAR